MSKQLINKAEIQTLPRISERLSFLYVEQSLISRKDNAITLTDDQGTVHLPAAGVGVLLLGPGTNISHRAMELLGDMGMSVIWVGERGIRYYAHGRPLTHSSKLLIAQAALVSNTRKRLAVARTMYQWRFPGEDVSNLTMQQLRGREGSRIRSVYRRLARETKLNWNGREYNPDDFQAGDTINQALSAAHACLYGLAHCVIVALGCSPGLGFIHTGHERSFVYDVADLYKAELTIPVAFTTAARNPVDVGAETRRAVRDAVTSGDLMKRMTDDLKRLLLTNYQPNTDVESNDNFASTVRLWDEKTGSVANGISYGKHIGEL
jgi:CRISPR-associated protein Cas1